MISYCSGITTGGAENSPQKLIDEKILELEECIRRFKSQRNQFAPVSRLPPEVLSTIFSYAASHSEYPTLNLLYRYSFSHVSQTWRSVAINAPALWHVLPSSMLWAKVMIERSKAVGLVIRLNLDHLSSVSPSVVFWNNVFRNHASRIRVLELTGGSKSTLSALFNDLQPLSLPLHSLRLWLSSSEPLFTFPANIVETKNIRSLSVSGCNSTWYSSSLCCLTELNMQNISNRPRFDEFFDTLRRNPYLQILDMGNSLPLASELIGSITSVNLPRLRRLRLSSTKNIKEISDILPSIVIPSTATVTLYCGSQGSVPDGLIHLPSSLSAFFAAMQPKYTHVDICAAMSPLQVLASEANRGTRSTLSNVHHETSELDLTIDPGTPRNFQRLLKEIFPSLPLLNITSLTLQMEPADVLMKETLRNLSQLRSITTIGNCTFNLIDALMHKPRHYYKKASAFYSVSFPALRSLCIKDAICGPGRIDLLRDCLMERYERKAELTELKLDGCYEVYSDDVAHLREIVVNVDWDEWEREETEPSPYEEDFDSEDYGCYCGNYQHDGYDSASFDTYPFF